MTKGKTTLIQKDLPTKKRKPPSNSRPITIAYHKENPNIVDNGGDRLLAPKQWMVSPRTKKMPQSNKNNT